MVEKYLNRVEFDSYEEFKADFKIRIPDNFNFAYDVVDETAIETPDKTAMEQRISALEKENGVLKNVINQVQTSIDPDQINRFKIEFNDLNSKTKQLEVQFDDDQSANKVMANNFFAVVKKLNEDIQDVKNTTDRKSVV